MSARESAGRLGPGHAESASAVLRTPATPLEPGVRGFMESSFGHSFADVRVHAGPAAAASARRLGANAYTVGRHIVVGQTDFSQQSAPGRRLLAHELTHVVQQGPGPASATDALPVGQPGTRQETEADAVARRVLSGQRVRVEESAPPMIQRDLATEPPKVAPAAQPELTAEKIQQAIAYNRTRYDAANTRLIQDLVGSEPTGTWVEDDILLIAQLQEEYGPAIAGPKDGMVGHRFFTFLQNEQRLEGMGTTTGECLTAFGAFMVQGATLAHNAVANTCTLFATFRTESEFSPRCRCSDFEYRQFIRGHWLHNRGGALNRDIGALDFGSLPAGSLTAGFNEDGDINDPGGAVNYGHRANPATANPVDHYIDNTGADDQANGCRYRSDDSPGCVPGLCTINDCRTGDVLDVDVNFRGEIQRNARPVQTRHWTAIRGLFRVP